MAEVIAEIGINHNGSVDTAMKLINAAAAAGADFVKLQKRTPELCVPDEMKDVTHKTPWGRISYLEYKERMEFDALDCDLLEVHARGRGLKLFYSVWDIPSLDFARARSGIIKIPSAKLTDRGLVSEAARSCERLLLSTGMSTSKEIDEAYNAVRGTGLPPERITVMHCHSAYPAPSGELNLRFVETLRRWYPRSRIGYSGHEYGIEPTVWAVILGAETVERHITLDHTMWGTDQEASVEPEAFGRMVKHIRSAEAALGNGTKRVWDTELPALIKLRGKRRDREAVS